MPSPANPLPPPDLDLDSEAPAPTAFVQLAVSRLMDVAARTPEKVHRAPCLSVAALCSPLSAADAAFLLGACPWSCVTVHLPKGPSAYPLSCIVHTTSADSDRHFPLPLHTRNDVQSAGLETAARIVTRVVCYVSMHRVGRLHSSPILTAGAVSLCLCGTRDRTCCLPGAGA